jgi:hypothetical protein
MDILDRLRDPLSRYGDERYEAADEIERLRGLVHHAFCEGQITRVQWDDWKNSEVYAALKGDE